jgi:hypothetical protein
VLYQARFSNAISHQAEFRALAEKGVLLDRYYALTHPSQPNYVAAVGGSFWGMADDDFYSVSSQYVAPLRTPTPSHQCVPTACRRSLTY